MRKNSLILFICAALLCLSCAFSPEKEELGNSLNANDWEVLEIGNQSAIMEAKQVLIKTEAALNDLWKEAFKAGGAASEAPSVDFSDKWVVAAFMGVKNKGGFYIDVKSVEAEGEALNIHLINKSPGPSCMSTMAMEQPFIIFSVDQSGAKSATFEMSEEQIDCN